jgi:hypothetical protein
MFTRIVLALSALATLVTMLGCHSGTSSPSG